MRAVEIVIGCSIAFLVGHADTMPAAQFTAGILGVAVAAIGGLVALYRFQENWVEYRVTAESFKRERYRFLTGTEPYDGDDKFQTLVTRVEAVLGSENAMWAEGTAAKITPSAKTLGVFDRTGAWTDPDGALADGKTELKNPSGRPPWADASKRGSGSKKRSASNGRAEEPGGPPA